MLKLRLNLCGLKLGKIFALAFFIGFGFAQNNESNASHAVDTLSSSWVKTSPANHAISSFNDSLSQPYHAGSQDLTTELLWMGFEISQATKGSFRPWYYRGLSSAHVDFRLAGMSLSSVDGSQPNLQKVLLEWIDSLKISRASKAAGHALRVDLRADIKSNFVQTKIAYPWANEVQMGLAFERESSQSFHLVGTQFYPNRYRFLNRNRTPYNLADDRFETLQNGEFHSWQSLHGLRLDFDGAHWQQNIWAELSEGGLHGSEGVATETASHGEHRLQYFSGLQFEKANLELQLKTQATQVNWGPEDNIYLKIDEPVELGQRLYEAKMLGEYNQGLWQNKLIITPSLQYAVGLRTPSPSTQKIADVLRWNYTATRQSIYPKLSSLYDIEELNFEVWSELKMNFETYEATANSQQEEFEMPWVFGVFANRQTKYYEVGALYKTFNRQPEWVEKFGGGKGVLPNSQLRSEQGVMTEVYVAHTATLAKVNFAQKLKAYYQWFDDRIEPVHSLELTKFINGGGAEMAGIEYHFTGQYRLIELDIASYFNDSKTTGAKETKKVPWLSPWRQLVELAFNYKTMRLAQTYEYRSAMFTDRSNLKEVSSYHQLHSSLSASYESFKLKFEINNWLDTYIEDAYTSIPKPGRNYQFTLTKYF